MAKDIEPSPVSMTKGIITVMKYGGCSPKHVSKQFTAYVYILLTGLTTVLSLLKLYFSPPKGVTAILENCIMIFGNMQICAKYFTSVKSAEVLSKMLDSLYNDFWSIDVFDKSYREEAVTRYKIAKVLSHVYGTVVVIAISLFCFQAKMKGNKALVMELWIPHEEILKSSPYYEIVFIFEVILFCSSVCFSVIPLDRLFILLTCYICEQFKMIKMKIKEINRTKTNAENVYILRKCIIHHQILLKFLNNFESVYSKLFLPTIGTNFILITITMYGFILEDALTRKLTNIFIYVAVIGQLFAYCLAGQLIQDEGLDVGEAAYQCNWCDIEKDPDSRNVKMSLLMIIRRSQTKIELTVGGYIVLSMENFATVVRATFSFLTFIINFNT